jgi:hypothetical protein
MDKNQQSPSPEAKAAEEQALKKFLTDIGNVELNHGKKLVAVIERSMTGSQAKIVAIPLEQFKQATQEK